MIGDSKNPTGPILVSTEAAINELLDAVKAGRFDL